MDLQPWEDSINTCVVTNKKMRCTCRVVFALCKPELEGVEGLNHLLLDFVSGGGVVLTYYYFVCSCVYVCGNRFRGNCATCNWDMVTW